VCPPSSQIKSLFVIPQLYDLIQNACMTKGSAIRTDGLLLEQKVCYRIWGLPSEPRVCYLVAFNGDNFKSWTVFSIINNHQDS